ncbi:hypothetical protein GEMRC1_002791 [Eukaryota sp. GEM-RC1]
MVRFKSRYLLCEIFWESGLNNAHSDSNTFKMSIKKAIDSCFGAYGLGLCQSSLNVKYFNNVTNLSIVKISRDHFQSLWVALTLIRNFAGQRCAIRVIHTGGSMRSCQKAALEHSRRLYKILVTDTDLTTSHCYLDQEKTILQLDP